MKHVSDLWFERVSQRSARGKSVAITHVLVVVTDLLTDLEMIDTGDLDDLDHALRAKYPMADEVRFVPKRGPKPRKSLKELGKKLA